MAYPEKSFQQNLFNLLKMKNIQKSLLTLLLLFVFQITFSQITKEKTLVKGACEMCKERIEETAKKSLPPIIILGVETIVVNIVTNNSALKRLVDQTNAIIEDANA